VADVLQDRIQVLRRARVRGKEGIVAPGHQAGEHHDGLGERGEDADFGAGDTQEEPVVQTAQMGFALLHVAQQIQGKELNLPYRHVLMGVVLYELLVGKKPFIAEKLEILLEKIIKYDALPPSEARTDLPRRSDPVILRAMMKSRRSATELADFASSFPDRPERAAARRDTRQREICRAEERADARLALDAEIWELARAGKMSRVTKGRPIVKEKERGTASSSWRARGEVTRQGRLPHMVSGRSLRRDGLHRAGEARHATVESHTELLSPSSCRSARQDEPRRALQLTRALVRNVSERLALRIPACE